MPPPGNCTITVTTAATPSSVGSTASGPTSMPSTERSFLVCRGFLRAGDHGGGSSTRSQGSKVASSSPCSTRVHVAKGRLAMCSISTTCRLRARRTSTPCFIFQTTTQIAKNKKKHEKKTEKNTNRSILGD
ncbi:unnamed protein product, partial [Meganyctiphanes norvegica]